MKWILVFWIAVGYPGDQDLQPGFHRVSFMTQQACMDAGASLKPAGLGSTITHVAMYYCVQGVIPEQKGEGK